MLSAAVLAKKNTGDSYGSGASVPTPALRCPLPPALCLARTAMESQAGAISAAMQSLQTAVQSVEACPEADSAFASMVEAHRATVGLFQQVLFAINTMASLIRQPQAQQEFAQFPPKPLSESKCVSNLKTLGSDKSEFKTWNEKFINAISQTLGVKWRRFMRNLNRMLDQERRPLTTEELDGIDGAQELGDAAAAAEGLYYVLVEKTEGEAALRVNSGEPGEGMQAYMRVYLWFAGTTGLALTEKTRILMHPTAVKHEHEIADALERWSEQERILRAHGDEYKLSAAFKVTALRVLMTCKRELRIP